MASNITDGKKSIRLIGSQRYTHDNYDITNEAYTSTLDIKASEVYTEASYIPTSGLPFSGSSQQRSVYEAPLPGNNIIK